MKTNIQKDVKQNELKLNEEEIISVAGFSDLSSDEADVLSDFIYQISFLIYKNSKDEQS